MGLFDWRRKKPAPEEAPKPPDTDRAPDGISPLWSTLHPTPRGKSGHPPPGAPSPGTSAPIVPRPPPAPVDLLPSRPAHAEEEVFMAEPIPAPDPPAEPPPVLKRRISAPPPRFVPGMFEGAPVTVSRVRSITDPPPARPASPAPISEPPPASARPAVSGRALHGARTMMRIAYDAGDWDAVLAIGHKLLDRDANDREARTCVDAGAAKLMLDFTARLGDRGRLLRRVASDEWLSRVTIDARARALLARIDGARSIDDVVASAGLEPLTAMGILLDMIAEGVVAIVARG